MRKRRLREAAIGWAMAVDRANTGNMYKEKFECMGKAVGLALGVIAKKKNHHGKVNKTVWDIWL